MGHASVPAEMIQKIQADALRYAADKVGVILGFHGVAGELLREAQQLESASAPNECHGCDCGYTTCATVTPNAPAHRPAHTTEESRNAKD
jgi:hypothetical protein